MSSSIFLYYKIDNKHEEESYIFAKILSSKIKSTNYLSPESKFFEVVNYPTEWSEFSKFFMKDRIRGIETICDADGCNNVTVSVRHSMPINVTLFDSDRFNNLKELIDFSNNEITHNIGNIGYT